MSSKLCFSTGSVLDSFLCEESDSACYIKTYWGGGGGGGGGHHYHNWILGHIFKSLLILCLSANFVLLNVGSVQPDTSHTLSCFVSFFDLGEKFSGSFFPLVRQSQQFRQIQLSGPICESGSILSKKWSTFSSFHFPGCV